MDTIRYDSEEIRDKYINKWILVGKFNTDRKITKCVDNDEFETNVISRFGALVFSIMYRL